MSKILKCDRCGDTFDNVFKNRVQFRRLIFEKETSSTILGPFYGDTSVDLCRKCFNDFEHFLKAYDFEKD